METFLDNVDFSILDKRIAHLTKEQIENVMKIYYEGEKVSNILKKYEIKISTSQLYTLFPPKITGKECIHCKSIMVSPWQSKSWSSFMNENETYCIECGHTNSRYCNCVYCEEYRRNEMLAEQEKQKKLLEKKKATLAQVYDKSNWKLKLESDLTLEDKLYLAAILRSSLSENIMYVESLIEKKDLIAPTGEFEIEIIKTLTGREILVPHVLSDIDAFDIEYGEVEDDYHISYRIYKVRYRINIEPHDSDYSAMIKRLIYPDLSTEVGFKEFCYEKWKRIALDECLQYLLYQMNKVGYSFNPGDKTIRVFEQLLEHFSVSQIYGIIYRSVANSTQRYQAREITKIYAQNSVITSCENHGQRAIAQGWKLSHYSRIKDLPETYCSLVLFTSIMKIAELGFLEKPTQKF